MFTFELKLWQQKNLHNEITITNENDFSLTLRVKYISYVWLKEINTFDGQVYLKTG